MVDVDHLISIAHRLKINGFRESFIEHCHARMKKFQDPGLYIPVVCTRPSTPELLLPRGVTINFVENASPAKLVPEPEVPSVIPVPYEVKEQTLLIKNFLPLQEIFYKNFIEKLARFLDKGPNRSLTNIRRIEQRTQVSR